MVRMLLILGLLVQAGAAVADAAGTATYTVTLTATWSQDTHPTSFPKNPHFSGLIGGTHDSTVTFWRPGELATNGVRRMAEWGSQTPLADEVQAAIDAGQAGTVIMGDVLWTSPGQVATTFAVSGEFPLVSLTTMIAPSPDWFVGVAGLNLRGTDGWRSDVTIPLYPYDAGTDSGPDYASADLVTNPFQPIAAITGGPFTAGVPVASLTFHLDGVAAVGVPPARSNLSVYPNPFNPRVVINYEVPSQVTTVALDIVDPRGRRVRSLPASGVPGRQTTAWDGRGESGIRAASGMYFVRLVINGRSETQKITLLP